MKKLITVMGLIFVLVSCATELEVVNDQPETKNQHKKTATSTKSNSPVFDAFKAESAIQQNRDLMMLSTIVQIDGRYTLFLTKEEAGILGVSEAMYDKYLNIVEDMNNRKELLEKKK